jgi:hypothetical protein
MRTMLVGWSLTTLLLGGCATNGYSEFYTPLAGATPEAIAATRAAPPTGSPQVTRVAHYDERVYARQGYGQIGYSSFSTGYTPSEKDAITQAAKVGADLVVILSPQYQESVTTNLAITTPTTTTSQTSSSEFGNFTTTTNGTQTTYVPTTINRYEYDALYFVKRRYILGANFRELTDGERQQMQTNRGVYVTSVVDGTPAYASDILPGDVIMGMNGQIANGTAGLQQLIKANRGQTVEISIVRAGKPLSKQVSLP